MVYILRLCDSGSIRRNGMAIEWSPRHSLWPGAETFSILASALDQALDSFIWFFGVA